MNLKRMNILRAVMVDVHKNSLPFDLDSWADASDFAPTGEEICHTTCCAAGWAALNKDLQNDGLKLVFKDEELDTPEKFVITSFGQLKNFVNWDGCFGVEFADRDSWESLGIFFGLSKFQTLHIFDPHCYHESGKVTPEIVINHIDQVLSGEI